MRLYPAVHGLTGFDQLAKPAAIRDRLLLAALAQAATREGNLHRHQTEAACKAGTKGGCGSLCAFCANSGPDAHALQALTFTTACFCVSVF